MICTLQHVFIFINWRKKAIFRKIIVHIQYKLDFMHEKQIFAL